MLGTLPSRLVFEELKNLPIISFREIQKQSNKNDLLLSPISIKVG